MLKRDPKITCGLNLRELPYFRALLRAVEARVLPGYRPAGSHPGPGVRGRSLCRDSFRAPSGRGRRSVVVTARRGPGTRILPGLAAGRWGTAAIPGRVFRSAVSNSVPGAHPPPRSCPGGGRPGARTGRVFVFCVPNHHFLSLLSVGRWLDRIGSAFPGECIPPVFQPYFPPPPL